MSTVYGNVNVKYAPCKSAGQLKSAADYLLGKKKEQLAAGVIKTEPTLYNALGCNRDNFAKSILITRKMHGKSYTKIKADDILAHKLSISFHPADNKKLTYEEAYKIGEEFAKEFFDKKGFEVLFAIHTDTEHIHVHFLVSNCNLQDGKSFRRGMPELKEMCTFFGEQCRSRSLTNSIREQFYIPDKNRDCRTFEEYQMQKRNKLSFKDEIRIYIRNALTNQATSTVKDIVDYLKKYYKMDIRLKGNTISYALPYIADKLGKPVAVRGSRLGERFTVAGMEVYLKQKAEKKRQPDELEQWLKEYDSWIGKDTKEEKKQFGENGADYYEEYDNFLVSKDIPKENKKIFYGQVFEEFGKSEYHASTQADVNEEYRKIDCQINDSIAINKDIDFVSMTIEERAKILPPPGSDYMEELQEYIKRMKLEDKIKSLKYPMSVYDEFLEEYEYRKKIFKTNEIRIKCHICKESMESSPFGNISLQLSGD